MERTLQCPICGEPYKFYSYSAADQSACRDCVRKAEAKMRNKNSLEVEKIVETHFQRKIEAEAFIKRNSV